MVFDFTTIREAETVRPRRKRVVEPVKKVKPLPEPTIYTPEAAKRLGIVEFDIDPSWQVQTRLTPEGEHISFVSPEGQEVEPEDIFEMDGRWVARPEVEIARLREEEVSEAIRGIYPKLWPELDERQLATLEPDVNAILDWANRNQEEFLDRIQNIGRTPETETLLRTLGASVEEVELFFPTPEEEAELRAPQAVLEPEPEWQHIRTGEVITETEKAKRFPMGWEAELDEWRLTVETGRNYFQAFKVFGESLTKLPKQLGASILQAVQGHQGASVVNQDWADELIESANVDLEKFVRGVTEEYSGTRLPIKLTDLATLPQSMAFSLTAMGAGLGVGVPIAFAPVPGARVAAWAMGTMASGAVAFNMSSYQIMQTYLEVKNEEMKETVGRELTLAEEEQLKKDFSSEAIKYGLWEAVPEALSNLAFAKLLTLPLGKMVGKNIAVKMLTKIGGIYGEEFLTETITQKGQSDIEVGAGLREGKITWVEAFKEIAPQTFLLTTILGGLGQVGVSSVNRIKKSLKKEAGDSSVFDAINENITEDVFTEVEAESIMAEGVREIYPIKPPIVKADWERLSIPDRTELVKSVGLGEEVASKTWENLEAEERRALTTELLEVPEAVPEGTLPLDEISKYETRIPLDLIRKDEPESLARLTEEIKREGITEPITIRVREDGSRIVWDGIHRLIVAQDLGIKNVPVRFIGEKGEPLAPPAIVPPPIKPITPPEVAVPRAEVPVAEVKPPTVLPVPEVIPEADVEVRRQLDELTKMHDIWRNKLATSEQTKTSLAKFVRENLPPNVRGRYITAVAKVKTDAQLQIQMDKVSEFAELNAQKVLKVEIRKELKRTQAVVKDKILKGKFTPDVQVRLDTLNHNLELDRDVARDKMADNVQRYDNEELSYDEMVKANEALNFAGIDSMSSEELANTLEYIKILKTVGRSERQAKQETATERINVIRADIGNILTGGQGLKEGIGAVPRKQLAAKPSWLDTFVNWQYGLDSLADKLSKLDPISKPYQSDINKFVALAHRATARQAVTTRDAYNKVKELVREVYKVSKNSEVNDILNGLDEEVNLGEFALTEEYKANHPEATTITIKMTRDEMIDMYMKMQDSTLDNTFTTGMGWSQKVRDAVGNSLTVDEKKLVDAYFEFYEDYYGGVNPIYTDLYNVDMPHNPNYSPVRRDLEGDIAENVLTFQDAQQFAAVTAQSIKARVRNIRPLKFQGATKVLSNHIDQMEHFKAWATTMRDFRRVFANKEIRQAIEQYHGIGINKLLDTFMSQMARGGVETAATNRVADFLRRSFTKSILAIKPVVGLKQIPSLFAYISEMNVNEFFGGVADYWKSPITNFKFLYANSEGYRARVTQGFERDIRATMAKHGVNKISGRGGFTDWFLLQIRLADTFAVTQGMWAKYKAGLKEGLTQAEAIAAAEDTTNRTQPSFGIDTLSAIQNGGSWLKLMTMFQNQPNKYFRITGDNLRNFKYGRGSRAKAASTILLTWVVLPMMFQFIADAFQWKPERQARAGILGPLNFILIGGQLVQSIWGWLTDQPFDYQISPVAQTLRDLQTIVLKTKKLVNQHIDPYKDISVDDAASLIEYLAKATGQVTGLPTPYFVQVEKQVRKKLQEDEDIDIKDFLFSGWALEPPKKGSEEKVEDLNLLLGEPEEGAEDRPLSEKPLPIYTTQDWFRDIGNVYKNVLPQDVLDDPRASKESKAWAEYEVARSKADILPNTQLYKINTEDNDNTIFEYYQQWKAREKITSLEKLKEFDKQYPKAYLGNVNRQQYNILTKYLEAENKDDYLSKHPELRVNPRDEWLKENPTDNALLALGGQAKVLSLEAYNEAQRLVKELDIPDDAIPEFTLPPEGSVENYFKYNELGQELGYNSWEVQEIISKDDVLRVFLDREPIETPVRVLELKIKHRELYEQYDALETDEDRAQLKADNPGWVDDMRRIEAIDKDASDLQIEAWVERGKVIDEFGAGSSEAKVWLIDNGGIWDWAVKQELLTDDGTDWNFPVLRLNKKWRKEDTEYDEGIPERFKDIENLDERADKITEAREQYLITHVEYNKDRYRRDAYGIVGPAPEYKHFPENQIETYVEWNTNASLKRPDDWDEKLSWYEDDWFLIENKELYDTMFDLGIWKEARDFTKVPTREVFKKYLRYTGLPTGQPRLDYRAQNPDLNSWLMIAKGLSPLKERGDTTADLTRFEELSGTLLEIEKRLREFKLK